MVVASRDAAILDAARARFVERGVEATGIDELRAVTGLSTGSLYHRFGSKEGLAAAVFVEAIGSYQDSFRAALRRHPDAEAGIKAVVRAHLRWHARQPERARFLHENGGLARSPSAARPLDELNKDFFGEVARWWRTHAAYGALRDVEFDLAYVLWLGPAQEYGRLRLAGRTRVPSEAAADHLAEGAWHALRGSEGDGARSQPTSASAEHREQLPNGEEGGIP